MTDGRFRVGNSFKTVKFAAPPRGGVQSSYDTLVDFYVNVVPNKTRIESKGWAQGEKRRGLKRIPHRETIIRRVYSFTDERNTDRLASQTLLVYTYEMT